jgi:hypothetical protein
VIDWSALTSWAAANTASRVSWASAACPATLDGEVEQIRARERHTLAQCNRAEGHLAEDVRHDRLVDAVERAIVDDGERPGADFLNRLEEQPHASGQVLVARLQQCRDPEQRAGVRVVPARVHAARDLRTV